MGYQYWKYDTLHSFCMEAFQKFGFTEKEADIIQDVLLTSDLYGIESHGMQRMVRYHKCIEKGMIKIDAKPEVVFETPIWFPTTPWKWPLKRPRSPAWALCPSVTPTTTASPATMPRWPARKA